jgi:isopentenyl-diphosphate Delta-isomerase
MATQHEENVVLVDELGRPVGQEDKRTVHRRSTPRHLGFSCYGFDGAGRLLVTQRAVDKLTFPGVWTNTCCGHPAPGEPVEQAVRRRLRYELELVPENLTLVLPEFSYRASFRDIEENELCPVFVCRLTGDPSPRRAEVQAWQWWTWDHFLQEVADADSNLSPWARLQAPLLDALRPLPEVLGKFRS